MSPNPDLLLCDTDSLIQLFLTIQRNDNLIPLRSLRGDYGIQPAIVAEVETELMWTKRYGARFVPPLKKAIGNGVIEVLNVTAFSNHVPSHLAKTVFATFQSLGQEYGKYVDPGEAFTLAAAVTVNAPAMSNDKSALDVLQQNGMQLPSPVLRAFDLLCFGYQIGALEENSCDKARQELVRLKEHVPAPFQRASFSDGLTRFVPRILDGAATRVGAAYAGGTGYAAQLVIAKKGTTPSP